jgi:hypothetical protein
MRMAYTTPISLELYVHNGSTKATPAMNCCLHFHISLSELNLQPVTRLPTDFAAVTPLNVLMDGIGIQIKDLLA